MAKREEQKRKAGSAARQGRSTTNISQRPRTSVKTKPLPAPVNEEEKQDTSPRQLPQTSLVPNQIRRRQFLIGGAGLAASAAVLGGWLWAEWPRRANQTGRLVTTGDLLTVRWNEAALLAIHVLQPPMPVAARALAIMHTCMFDAWAAYHPIALGTQFGARLRQPADEQTQANKSQAISYAAYRALVDLFPTERARFSELMRSLAYDPFNLSSDSGPAGIGNSAAQAVLERRHRDGANQLGDLSPGAYSDYTGYQPINTADALKDPNFWQPLRLSDARAGMQVQQFACPQWADVTPFALTSATQFVSRQGPIRYPDSRYVDQAHQIVRYSAGLTDEQKVIAEYWADRPGELQSISRWNEIARFVSRRDNHTLDQNIQLFFALSNAVLDASIACWGAKRAYNAAYPATAIHFLFNGKQILAWAGPGKDVQWINGRYWLPYQFSDEIAPAFPEYCSEQSTFGAAAALVLRLFTGSDRLDFSYTRAAHTSQIEPSVPATSITLSWSSFSQAADQAGLSGCYSGTHFPQSDLDGRLLGSQVGEQAWFKAQSYIKGTAAP